MTDVKNHVGTNHSKFISIWRTLSPVMNPLLSQMPVVCVDCQTSGATPKNGQVIELGWSCLRACDDETVASSSLVQIPEDIEVPRRVLSITGLDREALLAAPDVAAVWTDFTTQVSAYISDDPVVCVAHFAQFEKKFLEDLAQKYGGLKDVRFICTYEIARRLLPELPKHSLRALSGFFSHPLPESRRSKEHVVATSQIWRALVEALGENARVENLDDLNTFLKQPPSKVTAKKQFPMPVEKRLALPASPGVYRFLDAKGDILYVGKARSLKTRVASYFHTGKKASHIREMLAQGFDLEYTQTKTALEAALLEADEIKRCSPPYNRALRSNDTVWFFSPGFESASETPSSNHCIGPFPRREPMEVHRAVTQLISGKPTESLIDELFAYFVEPPEHETLVAGTALFTQVYLQGDGQSASPTRLLALGYILNMRVKNELERPTAQEEDTPIEKEEVLWSPEKIVTFYLRTVACASHHWQRALWLCLLSESRIEWRPRGYEENHYRRLLVEGAEVDLVEEVDEHVKWPSFSDRAKTLLERCSVFDRGRFDRLRVLTSELRRVKGEAAPLSVYLSPSCVIQGNELIDWIRF